MSGCMACRLSTGVVVVGLVALAGGVARGLVRDDKPAVTPTTPITPAAPATPAAPTAPEVKPAVPKAEKPDPYVLGFTMKDIDGKDVDLAQYKGKVVLIVNVASKCGYTPQYEGLQKLYDAKKDAGLVILGFPANNFGSQEPGSDSEIKQFCTSKYNVTFPMFAKISVKGADQHPLYKKLSAQPDPAGGAPGWNFTKYLVDRSGNAVQKFMDRIKPDDSVLTAKIDLLLGAK